MNVYSRQQWVVAVAFYSLVPGLQSEDCLSRVVCWSEGLTENIGHHILPGPLHWDKWSLFLPSHAFWLMLNPFGLIILIASPAIKTTDAFVQLWGLQNVTKRFWRQQSAFLKVDLWLNCCPPLLHSPVTDCSRGQGYPTMSTRLLWRCIQGCGARYHRKRTAPFQRWVVKYSYPCFALHASYVCVCLSVRVYKRVGMHVSWACSASMCYISGRIRTSQTYLNT